jgi:hypothetical protein
MKHAALTLLALALAGTTAACSSDESAAPSTTPTVQASFAGLATPTGDPELDGLATAHPEPGKVAWVKGPFDDRFRISHARFDGSALRGEVDITSDVSTLLELQVLAGFYDAEGRYLGEGRWTLHSDDQDLGHPDESVDFTVRVPAAYAGKAAAVAAGVPVLVNE